VFERSEAQRNEESFDVFPFFDLRKREPEGQRRAVAFFCLLFFGESKEK
jgi:hypothetical protein